MSTAHRDALLHEWYDYLSALPCLACGAQPVEIAHFSLLPSSKSGDLMPRSHKTLAAFAALPLCPNCHRHDDDSVHGHGSEQVFLHAKGIRYPAGWIAKHLVLFMLKRAALSDG